LRDLRTSSKTPDERVTGFSTSSKTPEDRVTGFSISSKTPEDRITGFSISSKTPGDRVTGFSTSSKTPEDRVTGFSASSRTRRTGSPFFDLFEDPGRPGRGLFGYRTPAIEFEASRCEARRCPRNELIQHRVEDQAGEHHRTTASLTRWLVGR
jgi:hypothetical protein